MYVLLGGRGQTVYSVKNSMHFVYFIWIYKTRLPRPHTKTNYRNTNNPIYNCIKKYIEINSSKVLKDLCMKTFKRCMKEIFIRHKRKHISYLLTGRINTVNTSIIPKSIYIFTAVSFKIPRPFSQNRKKIFTSCIKMLMLLLFSCHVMSDSLWLQGLQDARLPCPLPSLRICPSSCPLNWWCQPTMSSSVSLFFFCIQCFPASGSFPVSQLFTLRGQNIGASASASILLKSYQGWFPLRLTGLISLLSKGLSRVFYSTRGREHTFFSTLPSLLSVQLLHAYMITRKSIDLTV